MGIWAKFRTDSLHVFKMFVEIILFECPKRCKIVRFKEWITTCTSYLFLFTRTFIPSIHQLSVQINPIKVLLSTNAFGYDLVNNSFLTLRRKHCLTLFIINDSSIQFSYHNIKIIGNLCRSYKFTNVLDFY